MASGVAPMEDDVRTAMESQDGNDGTDDVRCGRRLVSEEPLTRFWVLGASTRGYGYKKL
jgi:hypothetical protein